ncbi:UpxY family transcription antiterminator [Nafulsella turpanensis]|uniref:UpxY family transcription antiterminator n=1 Tax=Nafulsella turpanensis TaxID=1265690 RepID=UPI00034A73F7|nr:UpxY family transcription antiterminator [Nafulsella turpanensis]
MERQIDGREKWYALYTRSRAEKKLYTLLTQKGIDCYLPLKKTLRQYSDRKKWVEEPLLRCYLFVRISQREYFEVLNTAGAVRFVCQEGKAAAIPESQMLALQHFVLSKPKDVQVEVGQLAAGDLMEITDGPLRGVRGELQQIRGHHRLLLRFHSLGFCVHTEVSLAEVKRIEKQQVA